MTRSDTPPFGIAHGSLPKAERPPPGNMVPLPADDPAFAPVVVAPLRIDTARWSDAARTTILATIDGRTVFVPDDPANADRRALAAWEAAGGMISPYAPPPPTLADYEAALLAHLDATAAARGYAHQDRLAGYVGSTNPDWAADAASFVAWRDEVWAAAYAALAKVEGGAEPPAVEDVISALPSIAWPD